MLPVKITRTSSKYLSHVLGKTEDIFLLPKAQMETGIQRCPRCPHWGAPDLVIEI